jgi:hypothetical protein
MIPKSVRVGTSKCWPEYPYSLPQGTSKRFRKALAYYWTLLPASLVQTWTITDTLVQVVNDSIGSMWTRSGEHLPGLQVGWPLGTCSQESSSRGKSAPASRYHFSKGPEVSIEWDGDSYSWSLVLRTRIPLLPRKSYAWSKWSCWQGRTSKTFRYQAGHKWPSTLPFGSVHRLGRRIEVLIHHGRFWIWSLGEPRF